MELGFTKCYDILPIIQICLAVCALAMLVIIIRNYQDVKKDESKPGRLLKNQSVTNDITSCIWTAQLLFNAFIAKACSGADTDLLTPRGAIIQIGHARVTAMLLVSIYCKNPEERQGKEGSDTHDQSGTGAIGET